MMSSMRNWLKALNHILESTGNVMILGFGLLSTFIFWQILEAGSVKIIEPNSAMLKYELILACLIVLLGIERTGRDLVKFVRFIRRNRS